MPSIRAIAASALLLVACDAPSTAPRFRAAGRATPMRGGTLRFATYQQVRTLDPAFSYDEISTYAVHMLYDTLIGYEEATPDRPGSGLALEPHLAASWTVSEDGRTYRFTLRPGITFSDGQPVVAGDFEYAMERVLRTPESPFGPLLGEVEGAQDVIDGKSTDCTGIFTDGDQHVVVRLRRPYAAFPYIVAMPFTTPLKKAWVEKVGDQLRRSPLGTGPFRVESWSEGERLMLQRNPRHWNPERPYLDRVVMLENIPRQMAFLKFQAGELDTCDRLPAPEYVRMAETPAWKPYIQRSAAMNVYGERMNVRVKPFDDKRVRQALNYALDKSHTVRILNNGALPSHGIIPPGMLGRDTTLQPYPYDPEKAKRLLAEAGYPDGLDLEYVTLSDDDSERVAQLLQAELATAGIRLKITLMSFATYVTAVGKPDGPPFSYGAWLMDFPDPSNFMDAKFHSRAIADENASNDAFYANPELDRLLDEGRAETDPVRRADLYHQAERILYDDAPWLWNYHRLFVEVTQPYVKNYAPHPVWIRTFENAWLDVGPDGRPLPAGAP